MKNKVAIITGGNKGIGLNIARKLSENRYKVIVCGKTILEEDSNLNIKFIRGDLTKQSTHHHLVNEAIKMYGQLDLYVNNVGISDWRAIDEIDELFLEKIMKTNLYSAFWGCKASASNLSDNGSIINISSIAGKRGSKNNSAYVASKFAMKGLTQSLAKELGSKSIRVNAICPVLIKTKGLLEALKKEASPACLDIDNFFEEFIKTQSALNRLPTAEEVSDMVLFLASNKARAITGQCINVDCGVFPQ